MQADRTGSQSAVLRSPYHSSLLPLHSASILITEHDSEVNPHPQSTGQGQDYLSPSKLREVTGTADLTGVTSLELTVNSSEHSLGNFGAHLPCLAHLRLVNSVVPCVRDLGTSLNGVQVLWLPQCRLRDLDGLSSLPNLRELYVAFNHISDISMVTMLPALEVLDVEGNNLSELDQLGYLSLCVTLTTLTLEGNPLHTTLVRRERGEAGYRAAIGTAVPQLRILDDLALQSDRTCSPPSPTRPGEWETDLNMVHSSLRLSHQESTEKAVVAVRPKTAPTQRGTEPTLEDSTSELTHGLHQVICGNPVRALRARRRQNMTSQPSPFIPSPPASSYTQNQRLHSLPGGEVSAKSESANTRSEERFAGPSPPPYPPPSLGSPDHCHTQSATNFRHRRYYRHPNQRDSNHTHGT